MITQGSIKYTRAILSFTGALIIFLIVMDVHVVSRQRKILLDEEYKKAQSEVELAGTFVSEPLLRHEFGIVEDFLILWSKKREDILELKAVTPNNMLLAEYKRSIPSKQSFQIEHRVEHEGSYLMSLYIVKDLTFIEKTLTKLKWQLVVYSVFLVFVLGTAIWFILKSLAIRPLEEEIYKRKLAETAIQQAHDKLKIVNEQLQQEVAERKKVEGQLLVFRRFVDASGQGFGIANIEGIIIYANLTLCLMTGEKNPEDTYGKPFFPYFPREVQVRMQNEIIPAVMKEGQWVGELPIIAADGKSTPTIENFFIINDEGDNPLYIATVITDITELKRTEQELELAKERAEESDRIKSAFLATMSHELRTPLNSIIGFTSIIMQELSGPLNEEQKEQLGMVQSSSYHLLNLINDVLDISKIEAGQLEVFAKPFDMRSSIENAVQIVNPLAEKNGLPLITDISPDVGEVVNDGRRVEQVLINLLNNAVKFTKTGEVRIECHISKGTVTTSVKDTGIGMQLKSIKELFKPFKQLDSGLARKVEGTGLGLSICKKLIELMGGEIGVESQEGVGSTFTFTLPLKDTRG